MPEGVVKKVDILHVQWVKYPYLLLVWVQLQGNHQANQLYFVIINYTLFDSIIFERAMQAINATHEPLPPPDRHQTDYVNPPEEGRGMFKGLIGIC